MPAATTASAIIPGRDLINEVELVDELPWRASRARDGGTGAAETSRATISVADCLMLGVRFALPGSPATAGSGTSAVMALNPTIRISRVLNHTPLTLIEILPDQHLLDDLRRAARVGAGVYQQKFLRQRTNCGTIGGRSSRNS